MNFNNAFGFPQRPNNNCGCHQVPNNNCNCNFCNQNRCVTGPTGPTAPSIYAQHGNCRNHAAFHYLKDN